MDNDSGSRNLNVPFGWLPDWVGFCIIIAVGIAAVVVGFVVSSAGLVAFGVAAIASAILAWVAAAQSAAYGNPTDRTLGARVRYVPDKIWYIVFGLFVIAAIIAIVTAL
jgi:hypothetical protein